MVAQGDRARRAARSSPAKPVAGDLERVQVESRAELRGWLRGHHLSSPGVWLVTFKKASKQPHVSYEEIVEELLCFGWIDSKANALDAQRSMLLCTPRKPKSGWSRPNKLRVERLTAAGKMTQRGLEVVELAQRNGTWSKLDEVEKLTIPDDLAAELARRGDATRHFEAFPRSAKRGILEWIQQAKRPETRQKRVHETATLAARNERANQWPRKSS